MMMYEATLARHLVPQNPFVQVTFKKNYHLYRKASYMQSLHVHVLGSTSQLATCSIMIGRIKPNLPKPAQ